MSRLALRNVNMTRRARETIELADEAYRAGMVRGAALMHKHLLAELPPRHRAAVTDAFFAVWDERKDWPK